MQLWWKKQQVPPLRFAPVGMTRLKGWRTFALVGWMDRVVGSC